MAEAAQVTGHHLLQSRPGAVALLGVVLALGAAFNAAPVMAQDLLQSRPGGTASLISDNIVNAILPVEEAFALQLESAAAGALQLHWRIAAGHYLYRQSLLLLLPDGSTLASLALPAGEAIEDEFFGAVEVYYESLTLPLPLEALTSAADAGASNLNLEVRFQGCAAERYCYPPHQQEVQVPLPSQSFSIE